MELTDCPDLYVIRHGQTEWNVAGRYQGQQDTPLTALGRVQARAVAGLVPTTGLQAFPSPLGRATATAALVLKGTTMRPHEDAPA